MFFHREDCVMKTTPQELKIVQFKKPIRMVSNKEVRNREYLTLDEVESIRKGIRKLSRNPDRDEAIILVMFRHALRVSEATRLQWDQVDLKNGMLHVRRAKGGLSSTHPIDGDELRLLRKLERDPRKGKQVFISEHGVPFSCQGIYRMVRRVANKVGIAFPVHPHMLRHGTGFYLANKGYDTRMIQLYMGHSNINNTAIYTQLSSGRFDGIEWR